LDRAIDQDDSSTIPADDGGIQDMPSVDENEIFDQPIQDQAPEENPEQEAPSTDELEKELENLPGNINDNNDE